MLGYSKEDLNEERRKMSNKYILKNKKPVSVDSVLEWGRQFEKMDSIVKQEDLPNGYWVSTVFLGLDHNFGGGKPLLFETMVFKKDKKGKVNFRDLDMDRYFTWEEAEKGHKRMVKKWKTRKEKK